MMDLKKIVDEIKTSLSANQVLERMESDLTITPYKGKKYICFMHDDSGNNPNMSFDQEAKRFHCFRCGGNYDVFDHYMQYYGLGFVEAVRKIVEDFGLGLGIVMEEAAWKKQIKKVKAPAQVGDQVLEYIKLRGIDEETIGAVGLGMEEGNVVFIYRDMYGRHLANKYRPARKLRNGENKNWWSGSANNSLYNMDRVDVTKPLVICEGEFDCISLICSGYKNVVSVPAGAKSYSWVEVNWDWLMLFDEITLWFDNDSAGKEGVRTIAGRLDNCTKIVYCDKANDINELLYRYGKSTVISELGEAVAIGVEGVLTVSQIANFNVYEAEKIRTRIKVIDGSIVGFVMGSLVVTTGYNGSGKSTLINQICIAESISQGYKAFVFSGELTPSNFKSWLYSTIVDEEHLLQKMTVTNKAYYKPSMFAEGDMTKWLEDKLFLYNEMDFSQEAILAKMHQLAKRKGVRVFVLDNLMKVELSENKNELLAQRKFVNELKAFAVKYNCIVHLVAHPRKPQGGGMELNKFEIAGSGDITNLADYVIGVHRTTKEEKEYYLEQLQRGKVMLDPRDACITLLKDRPTGSGEKKATLYFSEKRRRFYSNESELEYRYGYHDRAVQTEIEDVYPF